jgi:hypothetical protein
MRPTLTGVKQLSRMAMAKVMMERRGRPMVAQV